MSTRSSEHIAVVAENESDLAEEDQARADLYALIARLLIAAPDAGLLASLAGAASAGEVIGQPRNALDTAWNKLVLAAGAMDPHAAREEFNRLFVSISSPQINPYASFYLTGFINEKPLAALRTELAQLGLARAPGVGEMEDHLAALCDIMRLLIAGAPGQRQTVARQERFFASYIAPWYLNCLRDIRIADGVNFYRLVADFAEAFLSVESEVFEMEEADHDE